MYSKKYIFDSQRLGTKQYKCINQYLFIRLLSFSRAKLNAKVLKKDLLHERLISMMNGKWFLVVCCRLNYSTLNK